MEGIMSNISSLDTGQIKLMRWIARILSIPWSFWALFWTMFIVAQPNKDGESLPSVALIIILSIFALIYIGAAIIASVWGKEALGGIVLMADGALILTFIIVVTFLSGPFLFRLPWLAVIAFFTTILPPFIAGYLFLKCHRRSKTQRE